MASLPKFIHNLKGENIPYEEAKVYYENQPVKQIFKPFEKPENYHHITALYPFEKVYMDSMYLKLENSTLAFLNVMDLFSKFAYSKMFVLSKRSQALPSKNSILVFDEFSKIAQDYGFKIGMVVCDLGSEFLGDFMKHLETLDIPQSFANAGDKMKTSPIERFNKTLRLYLEKHRSVNGRITSNVLEHLLESYNSVPHAQLDYSPVDILKNKTAVNKTTDFYIHQRQDFVLHTLDVGTHVRTLLNPSIFQKIKPVWSDKIYTIERVEQHTLYYLHGIRKPFKREELQVVQPEFLLK